MKTLIAGTDSMEFGWVLMNWIPYVRYVAFRGDYDRVIIVCRAGNEALYQDFADAFILYSVDGGETDMWRVNGKIPAIPDRVISKYKTMGEVDILQPSAEIRTNKNKFYWYYG